MRRAPHTARFADRVLVGRVVVPEVPQRAGDDHHILFGVAPKLEQRHERLDAARLADGLAVRRVGKGQMLEGTGGLGGGLPDGLLMQQRHELLDAARVADRHLVDAVRVAREPTQRVRSPRGRARGAGTTWAALAGRAMRQQPDERTHAIGVADGVLVLLIVVRQVTQRGRRVGRGGHPVMLLHSGPVVGLSEQLDK